MREIYSSKCDKSYVDLDNCIPKVDFASLFSSK